MCFWVRIIYFKYRYIGRKCIFKHKIRVLCIYIKYRTNEKNIEGIERRSGTFIKIK